MEQNETIDLTPTWQAAARIYITVLMHGNPDGQRNAIDGILEMGKHLDNANKRITEFNETRAHESKS